MASSDANGAQWECAHIVLTWRAVSITIEENNREEQGYGQWLEHEGCFGNDNAAEETFMTGRKKGKGGIIAIIALSVAIVLVGAGSLLLYYAMPSLTLKGEEHVEIGLCQVYEDPGVSAEKMGADVSGQVEVASNLDTQVPGQYKIAYTLGDLSVVRYVTVKNTMDPVLRLKGEDDSSVLLGETFEDPGYSAKDSKGRDLTEKVKVETPDFQKAGTWKIKYEVTDNGGKTTAVERNVQVLPNTNYETPGLPICMYHYVYDESDPPDDLYQRYGNYIGAAALEEELEWLQSEDYYFPTWQEVREYVDGTLLLPEKSIVLCFDDGAKSFLENGIPVLEKCKVPATCFLIGSEKGKEKVEQYQSEYVTYQSHSYNMHRAGGSIGHGGIFTALSEKDALDDLRLSIETCGNDDAFAYPYGDYTQSCRDIVEAAGFSCAVTTEEGKARPGMDPLLLPRVRMSLGQTLEHYQYLVSPS